MKTNQSQSLRQKRCPVSPDIDSPAMCARTSSPEDRHRRLVQMARPAVAVPKYEIDSMPLDVRAVLPGGHRELGPAYLNITVDNATGQIVDAFVDFGAARVEQGPAPHNRYRPQHFSCAERALRRLLRPDRV